MSVLDVDRAGSDSVFKNLRDGGCHRHAGLAPTHNQDPVDLIQAIRLGADPQHVAVEAHMRGDCHAGIHGSQRGVQHSHYSGAM